MSFFSQSRRNRQRCLCLLLSAISITTMFAASADAQQAWRAINRAAKKYDKVVRDVQRTENQYNKRLYRQQEKLNRQNEQAIRKYYRTGKPTAVVLPYEPAPTIVYPAEMIVSPVALPIEYPVAAPPVQATTVYSTTYSSIVSSSVVNEQVVYEQPVQVNVASPIVQGEWTSVPPAPMAPVYQGPVSSEVIYEGSVVPQSFESQPVYGEFGEVVMPTNTAVSLGTPTPAQPANIQVNSSEPVENVVEGEPTLAPIPDESASQSTDD